MFFLASRRASKKTPGFTSFKLLSYAHREVLIDTLASGKSEAKDNGSAMDSLK